MIQDIPPRTMLLDDFMPYLHTAFTVECTPGNVELTLVEAYPRKDHAGLERPPFTLIFHSDPMIVLTEGLYVVGSEAFGSATIGLLSTGAAPGSPPGHYYQAVFN